MPSPYRRDVARLKAGIVERVARGEALRVVCGEAGVPGRETVRAWARADAAFGDALAEAEARGEWRRVWAFDEAVAAAFLARARAGETVKSLLGSAGMPSRRTYRHWQATQAPFAEAVFALRQQRAAELGARGRGRRRAFDPVLADRLIVALHKGARAGLTLEAVLAADPALPCRPTLRRWRRENPAFDQGMRMILAARRGVGRPVPEVLVDDIVGHIVEGGSFASYERAGGPTRATLRRWHGRDPAFAEAVAQACEWREDGYEDQILDIAMRTPPGPLRAMNRAVGPLKRQLVRLRHRPGAAHTRRG